jgi:O-methyltransferase
VRRECRGSEDEHRVDELSGREGSLRQRQGRRDDPGRRPAQIALLRLDTDWYESTKHTLEHLYPRLAPGGVLMIDDYVHWKGSRQATDEYFSKTASPLLLGRVDYT